MANTSQKQVIDLLRRNQKILVLPSSPPDGDSLGSGIALYLALKKLGKEVTVVCSDPVPEALQFLPNIKMVGSQISSSKDFIVTINCKKTKVDTIRSTIENDKVNIIISPKGGQFDEDDISFNKSKVDYDLIITVDCGELSQLAGIYENNIEMFQQIPVINIDHHISNNHFGKINHVDIMASSTTELLLPILEQLGDEENIELIDDDTATLLLAGIITDTGSFQNANTTPKAFSKAAKLVSYGARQQEIIKHIYKTKELSQLKLWGRILSKIQTDDLHRIVWSAVGQQDFKDTASIEDETGDVIDELMTNAPGSEVIILIKERSDGAISVSLRTTTPHADASKIAEAFGGGGHTQAAGFRVSDSNLRDVEYKIIDYVRNYQSKRLGFEGETTTEELANESELLAELPSLPESNEEQQTPKQEAPIEASPPQEKQKKKSKTKHKIQKDQTLEPGTTYKFED